MASVWTSSFSKVGSVDPNGSVWDSSFRKIGSVDPNGAIWTASFSKVGSVDSGVPLQIAGGAALLLLLS